MDKNEVYKFYKQRLDKAFNFIKNENNKRSHINKIDDTFLISLNRHLSRKGELTRKQHIALEEFMEKWHMG